MNEEELKKLVAEIVHGGVRTREEAFARILSELDEGKVPLLFRLIEKESFPLRNAVLELFRRLGGERLYPLLLSHLENTTTELRLFLAQVFRDLKDPRFFPVLKEWLKDPDPNVRAEVCDALGMIGDRRAVPLLVELLSQDPWVVGSVLIALGRFRSPEVQEVIVRSLGSEDLCLYAIIAIGIQGDPELLPPALSLGNADPAWIPVLLENLGTLLWELPDPLVHEHLDPPSPWIEGAMKFSSFQFKPGPLKVIRAFQVNDAFPRLIGEYLEGEEDPYLLETLIQLPATVENLEGLKERLKSDQEFLRWTRLWLFTAPENKRFLYDSLTHPSELVRLEVLLHWENLPEKPLDLLLPLLTDPDPRVRHQVLGFLKEGMKEEGFWERIIRFLTEEPLPRDLIPAIVSELPLPVISRVHERLRGKPPDSAEGEELLFYSELRVDPQGFFERVKVSAREGEEDAILRFLPLLQRNPDPRALQVLQEILPIVSPSLAYAVSETIVHHPAFRSESALSLLRFHLPEEAIVPLLHALEGAPLPLIRAYLEDPPSFTNPLTEWELLRLFLSTDPALGKERFRKALHSRVWFLEEIGAKGLLHLGLTEEIQGALPFFSSEGRAHVEQVLKGN
jgi:HEAT repeat protein